MSEELNKFDDLIREKFSAKDFPFDEENWERAEAKMDVDKKRKRFLWISAVFLFGLSAGVAIMLPFINTGSQPENKMIVQVETKQKTLNQIPNSKNENEQLTLGNDKANTASSDGGIIVHHPSDGKNENKIFTKDQTNAPSKEKKKVQYSSTDRSPSVPKDQNNKVQTKVKDPIISADEHPLVSPMKNAPTEIAPVQHTKSSDAIPFADVNDADNKKIYGMIKLDSSDLKKIGLENNSVPVFPKKDLPTGQAGSTPSIVQEIPKDSVNAPHLPTVEPSAAPQPQKLASTNIYSIDAGTNYLFGWNYGKDTLGREARGFNPVLGFGFTHFFNTKWSFNTGIQYGSIAHLNSQKIFSNSEGDFGLTKTDTIIDTKWIHYAVVPIFVHYTLNDKNSIGLGGSIGYLINTTSDYITNTQSDFKQAVQTKVRSFGFTDGFSKINATCGIAYRRRITNTISITAEAHYGLVDIKNDQFFSKQLVERNSGIKLTVSYSLFNHK